MQITLTPYYNLNILQIAQVNSTLSRMLRRGIIGKNTLAVSNISVSSNSVLLTVHASNKQTDGQLIGSIKGSLGKSLGIRGLFH